MLTPLTPNTPERRGAERSWHETSLRDAGRGGASGPSPAGGVAILFAGGGEGGSEVWRPGVLGGAVQEPRGLTTWLPGGGRGCHSRPVVHKALSKVWAAWPVPPRPTCQPSAFRCLPGCPHNLSRSWILLLECAWEKALLLTACTGCLCVCVCGYDACVHTCTHSCVYTCVHCTCPADLCVPV